MLYVIKTRDGVYFHNKGKIILYESQKQATRYLNEFIEYVMARLVHEGNPHGAMTAPMIIQSNSIIMPIDFNINEVECGTVYVTDI